MKAIKLCGVGGRNRVTTLAKRIYPVPYTAVSVYIGTRTGTMNYI